MSLWKEQPAKDQLPDPAVAGTPVGESPVGGLDRAAGASRRRPAASSGASKESLIAADVTIEGKVEGSGHVRIAGRFKGDVNVEGNVTIEEGAHVTGQVNAATVIVSGEVQGNINASSRIELLESGVINGDVKAALLTVAAGSKMRGQADFGWGDEPPRVR
jgi:cytoskeletal protein CcmA (bactofilin family)